MNKKIVGSILTTLLLIGCGSDSTTTTTTIDNNDLNNSNTTTNLNKIGYFIDAEVEGLEYSTTTGLDGITDKYGRFQYTDGDIVTFSMGNLVLGKATPTEYGLVTPETFSNETDNVKTLILRVLQSVDIDNNPTNGIVIPSTVTSSLNNIETINISDIATEDRLLSLDNELALAIDENFDNSIDVNATLADVHFKQSLDNWNSGNRPTDAGTTGNLEDINQSTDCNNSIVDINSTPKSNLSQELKDGISHMGNEERLAYDVYHNLYDYHFEESAISINQLKNISERSEVTHVGIVQDIVRKYELNPNDFTNVVDPVATRDITFEDMPSGVYDIPAIQNLYDALYSKGTASMRDALEVGCMVEVTDIDDLDRYLVMAKDSNASDVEDSFTFLRDASYDHYWAFDGELKNIGITNGCCSLGTINGVSYCHNEYPQNEESQGNGNGQGAGQGQGRI